MNAPSSPDLLSLPFAALRDAPPPTFLTEAARLLDTDETTAGERLAFGVGLKWLDHDQLLPMQIRTDLVPLAECRRRACCIVEQDGALVGLLMQPLQPSVRTFLQSSALPTPISLALVSPQTLDEILESSASEAQRGAAQLALDTAVGTDAEEGIELPVTGDEDGPLSAVSLVNRCLGRGAEVRSERCSH